MSHRSYTTVLDRPPAGVDWSFVPSTSDWSRLLSITAVLTVTAVDSDRYPSILVTDETGNLIAADTVTVGQDNDGAARWSWRSGSMYYGGIVGSTPLTSSIPGFWLPPGSTVAAQTTNLDTPHGITQAFALTADESSMLPVTIVLNTNDKFSYTPTGGTGMAEDFQIAAGVYATIATMAAAISAAVGTAAEAFSTKCTCAAHAGSSYLFTAVSDVGAAGNNNTVGAGSVNDAFASIFAEQPPFALAGGADVDVGDQWSDIVATYVVADARHWEALEAMLAQLSPGS